MSLQKIKALKEKRGDTQKQMKQILTNADTEKRDTSAEENAKFDEMSKLSDEINGQIYREERVIELEDEAMAGLPQPGRDDVDGNADAENRDAEPEELEKRHAEAVDTFLRQGHENMTPEQRQIVQPTDRELRALSISGIGVVGARGFYKTLVTSMKGFDGVRQAGAEVISTSTGADIPIPTTDDTGNKGERVGEAVQTGQQDPTIGNKTLRAYKYSSKEILVSIELLQDAEFDLEAYINDIAGERIGRIFNEDTTTGDDTNKPHGFTIAAAANTVEAADDLSLSFDDLLDLINGVDGSYWGLPSAAFQMHQGTLIGARKLKDNEGRPIWTPAFGDVSERIHGKKVVMNNELGVFGGSENDVVAAFGAWSKYKVRDVTRPVMIRDPYRYARNGQVAFIVFSRHDGELADTKAVSLLDLPAGS